MNRLSYLTFAARLLLGCSQNGKMESPEYSFWQSIPPGELYGSVVGKLDSSGRDHGWKTDERGDRSMVLRDSAGIMYELTFRPIQEDTTTLFLLYKLRTHPWSDSSTAVDQLSERRAELMDTWQFESVPDAPGAYILREKGWLLMLTVQRDSLGNHGLLEVVGSASYNIQNLATAI